MYQGALAVVAASSAAARARLHNALAQRKRVTSRPRHAHLLARAPPPRLHQPTSADTGPMSPGFLSPSTSSRRHKHYVTAITIQCVISCHGKRYANVF
ncbi:hypothetical protein B5X24_HaOG212220 [Helicoverpa armigera]|nr:hypothetical protein B5X24_HaOG212220 [Helicoverpa armigera]